MRILMVAEGEHELHGALEKLVERLLPPAHAISDVVKLKISDPAIGHVTGRGPKLLRRVLFCMRKAIQLQCDALVLIIDEDGDHERRRHLREAQNSTHFPIKRAIGIAIKTFDAWMLADETALSKALGSPVPCQSSPEEVVSPKELFMRLKDDANCQMSIAEAYAAVASHVRLDLMGQRCPDGFAPFARNVKSIGD